MNDIDFEQLLKKYHSKVEILNYILDAVVEELPKNLEKLQKAIDAGDFDSIKRVSHSIKGGVANIISGSLTDSAGLIEQSAKVHDRQGVLDGWGQMEPLCRDVLDQIEKFQSSSRDAG